MLSLAPSLPGPGEAGAVSGGTQIRWRLCIHLAACSRSMTWENRSLPLQIGNKLAEIHPRKPHRLSTHVTPGRFFFSVIYSVFRILSNKLSAASSKYKRRVVYSCLSYSFPLLWQCQARPLVDQAPCWALQEHSAIFCAQISFKIFLFHDYWLKMCQRGRNRKWNWCSSEVKLPISVTSIAGKQVKKSKHVANSMFREGNCINNLGVISCVIAGNGNTRFWFLSTSFGQAFPLGRYIICFSPCRQITLVVCLSATYLSSQSQRTGCRPKFHTKSLMCWPSFPNS